MWRWARWLLLVAAFVVTVGGARWAWSHHRDVVEMERQEAIDGRLLAQMRQQYPIGTSRAQVVAGLRARYPSVDSEYPTHTIDVWLDHEPSFVWFCNFMSPYFEFSFSGEGSSAVLMKIERKTTGECL